ncbi:hypothetical protein LTR62_001103 [Meristemomyces frigidus]|uniref:rRNA-processing protein EFG1 n=1 Tax=Meristemomyces frigidus TaxID=1508187 RepID=A0AAN7T9K0_9PEZI|nr:hypothetical protein LTR62_001103 [Meristemomyces frigidus]
MATKRPHAAIAESTHAQTHPSRRGLVPGTETPPPSKRARKEKPAHITGPSFKKAHTVHGLKSRIRSLRRGLQHNDALPATIREEKERALKSAETELAETERKKKRSEVIGRWHKVRFFERKRAEKRLALLKKRLADQGMGAVEKVGLERDVKEAEVDVAYTISFPLETEYVPLFPRRRKGEDKDEEMEKDKYIDSRDAEGEFVRLGEKAMWERVRQSMADGTLEVLREGKLDRIEDDHKDGGNNGQGVEAMSIATKPTKPQKREKAQQAAVVGNRRERRKAAAVAAPVESEDDSDAGFFE